MPVPTPSHPVPTELCLFNYPHPSFATLTCDGAAETQLWQCPCLLCLKLYHLVVVWGSPLTVTIFCQPWLCLCIPSFTSCRKSISSFQQNETSGFPMSNLPAFMLPSSVRYGLLSPSSAPYPFQDRVSKQTVQITWGRAWHRSTS